MYITKSIQVSLTIRPALSSQHVDGELIILDKDNNKIHQLNAVASFIWQMIDSGSDFDEVLKQLVSEYDIDEQSANTDLMNVIRQFKDLNLIY